MELNPETEWVAVAHGWHLLFADRHPYAGGAGNSAAYLENQEGFEVELVATADVSAATGPVL